MKPREPRRKVLIQARMRIDGAWTDVCIRDISSRGLMAVSAHPPGRNTYIEIFRGAYTIVGRVVWSKDRRFGIRTQDKLNIDAIVQEPKASAGAASAVAGGVAAVERRQNRDRLTPAEIEMRAERSRRISNAIQFGFMAMGLGAAAVLGGGIVREFLGNPLAQVSSHLAN